MQFVFISLYRTLVQHKVRILAGLLHVEKTSKHNRIPFGGHAAIVVDSGVERDAVRQQSLSSAFQAHVLFIQQKEGPEFRPLSLQTDPLKR